MSCLIRIYLKCYRRRFKKTSFEKMSRTILTKIRDKIGNRWLGRRIHSIVSFIDLMMMSIYKDKETIKLIKNSSDNETYPNELFMVLALASIQKNVKGSFAEVGVFNGCSAKIICEGKGNKSLYLFDTFEGLPGVRDIDEGAGFSKGMYNGNYESVKRKLSKYENVYIYKGLFPGTGEPVKDKKFAFVNLDVDIYQSTKDCLKFFYERMEKGGIILSHDYQGLMGVKKAFDEFFADKGEEIIQLYMSQCMVIKR
jgi:O-methyltransferase